LNSRSQRESPKLRCGNTPDYEAKIRKIKARELTKNAVLYRRKPQCATCVSIDVKYVESHGGKRSQSAIKAIGSAVEKPVKKRSKVTVKNDRKRGEKQLKFREKFDLIRRYKNGDYTWNFIFCGDGGQRGFFDRKDFFCEEARRW
jgi:hypothetical protein